MAYCHILLDINNIYVSAINHGFDPADYLAGVPAERVWQFHLAGHTDYGGFIIDTHDQPVIAPVWALYRQALMRFGAVSTLIERDDNMPPLSELLGELDQARRIATEVPPLAQAGDAPQPGTRPCWRTSPPWPMPSGRRTSTSCAPTISMPTPHPISPYATTVLTCPLGL